MAQAVLLNNLNTSQTTTVENTAGNKNVPAGNDFQMLFEEKTSSAKTKNNTGSTKDSKAQETDKRFYTLGSLKDNNPEILQNLAELLQETLPEETSEEQSTDLIETPELEDDTSSDAIQSPLVDDTTDESSAENADTETDTDKNEEKFDSKESPKPADITNNQAFINQEMQNSSIEFEESTNENEEELTITLNGKDIDKALEEFGIETEEVPAVNLTKNEATPELEDGKTLENLADEETLKELKIESLEAEAGGENEESDLMQNQTPEEQGVKAIIQADVEYNEIKTTDVKPAVSQPNKTGGEVTPGKIIEQISKQLETMYNGSKVNIVLNPESLGKVSIQLINTPDGLSAQFTVATQDAKNLLMKGLDGLKDALLSHGVSVDNVTVKMNETQESEYNADWTEQEGSGGGNQQGQARQEEQDKERFEQMMFNIENKENGKV